jgi:hypothetical protein
MAEVEKERFGVSAEDLRKYSWQKRIRPAGEKSWLHSRCDFAAAAKECKAAGDDLGFRVYSLLHTIASFHPQYDSKENPYGPCWSGVDGKRSLMAEDLSEKDLDVLADVVAVIDDADFRARVADVLWECRRDYKMAEIAVRAFLEAAQQIKTDNLWPPYSDRLERAANLAAKLGFGKPLHQEVLSAVESAIAEFEVKPKSGLLCNRLMEIALAHEVSDTLRYTKLSERLANDFAAAKNWDFSEAYWQSAGRWYIRRKEESEVRRCQLAAAECLISKAEQGLQNDKLGPSFAAHWMGAGVQALRQARGDSERINTVHRRFLEVQKEALTKMNPMELDVDAIPGFRDSEEKVREAAVAHVAGYSFERAVVRLAHIAKPTDSAHLREQLQSQSKEFIWDKIVSTEALDHSGKVADIMPPTGFGPEDVEEEGMRKRMVQQAKEIAWRLAVAWKIEPARVQIVQEHPIRRRDLIFLVANNPFIPPGHEGIYLRGLQAGFLGDWLVAMHLLIPQIEASIRHVFQQHEIVTSTIESDGTQKERDLNQLLWMPNMEDIFGPDIAFDLRGILVERFGDNMRNESAHGLMPEGAFYQHTAVYLWWLALYLCVTGHVQTRLAMQSPDAAKTTAERDSSEGNDATPE